MATAKDAKKKDEAAVEAPPPPKSSKKKMLIIIIAAVLVLLVIGVGATVVILRLKAAAAGDNGGAAHTEQKAADTPEYKLDPSKPPVYVNLDAFTVNLQSDSGEQYLQVVATLQVVDDKVGERLKQYMPQVRHEFLALMSGKKPAEVTTQEGRLQLADEMKEVANEVLGYQAPRRKSKDEVGPIVAVYFTQFIVQ